MHMKRIIYILAIALVGALACTRELAVPEIAPSDSEKGLVEIRMKVKVPAELSASTRSSERANLPQIDAIRVAVFGISGYPQAYALAEPVDASGDPVSEYATTNGDEYYFKVLLPIYEGEAHVHIIANGPESIPFLDQDEESIMKVMTTTDGVGGYWARLVLPEGIIPIKDDNGIMQTTQEGYFLPNDETAGFFKEISLVRNFAEINLDMKSTDLTEVSWALVNAPTSGSMAIFSGGAFVDDFTSYEYVASTGRMAKGDVIYPGYMVSAAIDDAVPAADDITTSAADPLYSYERVLDKTTPSYIMLKGKFKGDSEFCYYRVDLMDEEIGGYFPIYRNYAYTITVSKVGNRGASSPELAAQRNSGGNITLSAEAKTLTDISDGTGRLFVEYVEHTYISGGEKSFWVQYIPDVINHPEIVDNSGVSVSIEDAGTALVSGGTIELDTQRSSQTGYYFYKFKLNGQNDYNDLSSVFQVKATNGETGEDKSTLYRSVTVKVMKKMDMTLSLDPKRVDSEAGETTVLHIALSDTLQPSMFPLEFYIEDTKRVLNPTGSDGNGNSIAVPVQTGPCIYDEDDDFCYHFIRTVNWSEYESMHAAWIAAKAAGQSTDGIIDFTTEFKTLKGESATKVYVACDYFNMQSVNLLNDGIFVSPLSATVAYDVTSAEISIEASEDDITWSVEGGDGVTVSPASGTGNGKFTMTFTENNTNAAVQRTATVTSQGKSYTVTITQNERQFSLSPSAQTVLYNATSVTVQVVAEDDIAWTAVAGGGASLGSESASGTGSKTLTLTFDQNGETTSKTYSVTITETGTTNTASCTITQTGKPQSPYPFSAGSFTISDNAGVLQSGDGYVSVSVDNASKEGNSLEMGYYSNRNEYAGTMTITPVAGMKIVGVTVTYSNGYAYYDNYGYGGTWSIGSYSISGTTGTWTGSSAGPVTYTFGYTGSGRNANFPRITAITVSYEAE